MDDLQYFIPIYISIQRVSVLNLVIYGWPSIHEHAEEIEDDGLEF